MDWFYNLNGFWIFALLCVLFMAIMMIACHGMRFRCGHCSWQQRARHDGSEHPGAAMRQQ